MSKQRTTEIDVDTHLAYADASAPRPLVSMSALNALVDAWVTLDDPSSSSYSLR